MKIVIASGKGGTGKTTIATNLACSISNLGKSIQYLDCDVEEPNGHIFLRPDIEKTERVTIQVPEVDLEKCVGCGKCGKICQFSAIICLKNKAMVFNQLCHSCGGCRLVCPSGAIKEKENEIGFVDSGRVKKDDILYAQGRLKVGDIHTVPLIRQLKNHSVDEGIVIMDAPPGTSCPVIEAVKDADFVLLVTEPTPFGLNDLKLAVGMVRELQIPFAVVINRSELDEKIINDYCKSENIDVLFEVPDDVRIAKAYSIGRMMIHELPETKEDFIELFNKISMKLEGKKQKKSKVLLNL